MKLENRKKKNKQSLACASTWLDPLYTAKEKNVFQSLIHFCFIWMDGLNISTRFDFVQKIKKKLSN